MSPDPKKTKEQIKAEPEQCIIVQQPMVRTFSTGGGHGPEPVLVEGDRKIVTTKWQGYPPDKCNIIGKPHTAMPEVMIPRLTGKALYATRVAFPNMLFCKMLTSPHAHARVAKLDVSQAEKMPGVAYVLTAQNAPPTHPFPGELFFQGEVVAIVAADTEDQAEDAAAAISVEYEVLPFASTLQQVMAPNAPDLSSRRDSIPTYVAAGGIQLNQARARVVRSMVEWGDVDKAFAQADVVREFAYTFGGAIPVPLQPGGAVAKWDGDKVTVWGLSQEIYSQREGIAKGLGIPAENVRYIDKWNGGSFGGARSVNSKFSPWVAYIAKMTGRPVKLVMLKEQELAHMQIKPQTLTKFKVGAMKDGKIIACQREFHVSSGVNAGGGGDAGGRSELYLHVVPNWKEIGFLYRTNAMAIGPSRSNSQQEYKWAWENMIDEMAEAVGMDPVKFRLLNVQKPGTRIAIGQGGPTIHTMPETQNGLLTYDCYASVEVLEEGAKAIGWDQRNPAPGGNPGRFKRGFGVAMSHHHAGSVGYQDGEAGFEWVSQRGGGNAAGIYNGELEIDAEGHIILHYAQPDSGTNHGTSMSIQVGEILGFTTLDHMRVVWGDSDVAPPAPGWHSGLTTQLQGGALCNAADKLRKELLKRASETLKVDAAKLRVRDGVISSTEEPGKRITFAELVKANKGSIQMTGRCVPSGGLGRAMNRGIGACFAEVEVDTWTGDWRYVKAAYAHDAGNVMNPLLANADMHGSLIQSTGMATDAIPWDREFPGTRHYSVGYLSYRLPTIMEPPEQINIFINSLEPRWFFGSKGFAETAIGAPPGTLANAIYNACGVRIREHPVSKDAIMAGLKARVAKVIA